MQYVFLPWIVEQELPVLHKSDRRWMPRSLFQQAQIRLVLQDMRKRYLWLSEAKDELKTLERGPQYIKLHKRMVFDLRRAYLFWKGDHLAFIRAVAAFYSDYGAVMQLLKQDYDRGKFKLAPPTSNGV